MMLCKKRGKDTYFYYEILLWIVHSLATQDAFGHKVIKKIMPLCVIKTLLLNKTMTFLFSYFLKKNSKKKANRKRTRIYFNDVQSVRMSRNANRLIFQEVQMNHPLRRIEEKMKKLWVSCGAMKKDGLHRRKPSIFVYCVRVRNKSVS